MPQPADTTGRDAAGDGGVQMLLWQVMRLYKVPQDVDAVTAARSHQSCQVHEGTMSEHQAYQGISSGRAGPSQVTLQVRDEPLLQEEFAQDMVPHLEQNMRTVGQYAAHYFERQGGWLPDSSLATLPCFHGWAHI
jgi:hypothetical protein